FFYPARHEPGAILLLGKAYAAGGMAQGESVLEDLARHPATARHLAQKLAAHFISDVPPQRAIEWIETAYLRSDGNLAMVAAAIEDCPEAWDPTLRKVKTPCEFLLSAARLDPAILTDRALLMRAYAAMGQRPFAPPSPKGWPEQSSAWLAPHSYKERL